jgi:class III poly(R)-hydroxyalkanoic acid synthase PhaE subunit
MADSNPFDPDNWLSAQRKYWDAWMDLSRKTLQQGAAPQPQQFDAPWAGALDQWWKAVSAGVPNQTNHLYDRLIGLGRSYFSLAEQMAGAGADGMDSTKALRSWMDQMTRSFHAMIDAAVPTGQMPSKDFAAFWQLPMDTWQRTVSSFSPFPGDFMKALQPEDMSPVTEAMRDQIDRFLSVPGVGYTRESQEQYQRLSRLLLDYQQALRDYNVGMSKVGLKSVDVFREKVEAAAEASGPVNSLRELFNLWVDACEDVYAEYVMSDEYSELYGALVNALMTLKHQGGLLVDEYLESMNMPTRREVTTLHHRLQETRREIHALRNDIEALNGSSKANTKPAVKPAAAKPKTQKSTPKAKAPAKEKTAAATKGSAS